MIQTLQLGLIRRIREQYFSGAMYYLFFGPVCTVVLQYSVCNIYCDTAAKFNFLDGPCCSHLLVSR